MVWSDVLDIHSRWQVGALLSQAPTHTDRGTLTAASTAQRTGYIAEHRRGRLCWQSAFDQQWRRASPGLGVLDRCTALLLLWKLKKAVVAPTAVVDRLARWWISTSSYTGLGSGRTCKGSFGGDLCVESHVHTIGMNGHNRFIFKYPRWCVGVSVCRCAVCIYAHQHYISCTGSTFQPAQAARDRGCDAMSHFPAPK